VPAEQLDGLSRQICGDHATDRAYLSQPQRPQSFDSADGRLDPAPTNPLIQPLISRFAAAGRPQTIQRQPQPTR